MQYKELESRVALVTGGSRGIGEAIARRLADEGLRVAVLGRDRAALEAVAHAVGGLAVQADLTAPGAIEVALARVREALGEPDVLVNNAGSAESAPLHRVSDEDWERAFASNVKPAFVLCRALMPGMVKRGWGRVVNVASNAGLSGYAYTVAYCAAKHAMVGMTRALAAEFARTPVTVNAVCPGFVDTEMARGAIARIVATTGRTEEQARGMLEGQSPQRRLMTVDEVAHAVAMLLPDFARGVHGQALALDGGQVMK